jgi:hypothetical protein
MIMELRSGKNDLDVMIILLMAIRCLKEGQLQLVIYNPRICDSRLLDNLFGKIEDGNLSKRVGL